MTLFFFSLNITFEFPKCLDDLLRINNNSVISKLISLSKYFSKNYFEQELAQSEKFGYIAFY